MSISAHPSKISYSPKWAPHVVGEYPKRRIDPETGAPEEQKWTAKCDLCGTVAQGVCTSGLVNQHIANFALAHSSPNPMRSDKKTCPFHQRGKRP